MKLPVCISVRNSNKCERAYKTSKQNTNRKSALNCNCLVLTVSPKCNSGLPLPFATVAWTHLHFWLKRDQKKPLSNSRWFGQPNAVFGWCAVQVSILRNNKKNKLKYYISVIKTMIRIIRQQIKNNFSTQEKKKQFQSNNLWLVRSELFWQLRQTLAYLIQCFVYLWFTDIYSQILLKEPPAFCREIISKLADSPKAARTERAGTKQLPGVRTRLQRQTTLLPPTHHSVLLSLRKGRRTEKTPH